jgi:glycosyltransferase involved in cell wall biosynthesis
VKPVLFVTSHAPPDRVGAFAALHEREDVEFALFGGRQTHGPPDHVADAELDFPHRRVDQRAVFALAASRRYRAVICSGSAGRLALPAAWAGARAGGRPLVLWTALWAHPRSLPHALSWVALQRLYRSADAVVTYGVHVSEYVRAHGARNVHIAPQSVDNDFWSAAGAPGDEPSPWPSETRVKFLFVGRPAREKGLQVLHPAWRAAGLSAPSAALVLAGVRSTPPWISAGGAVPSSPRTAAHGASWTALGTLEPRQLRNLYAAADVLVMPSIATPTFREPWGLVANEAMNQHLPVIASDAVGAAAGGLVRHERSGLVVPAGDARALAGALRRLAEDGDLRRRLGDAAARDVQAFSHAAWAAGFSRALASVGRSRPAC